MVKYEITTPHGSLYLIHDNGDIQRTDMQHTPSGQWKLVGVENVKSFHDFTRFDHLDEWLATNPQLLYKNGNPRYTVRDFDHGSIRSWGNTQHHGIKSIRKVA